MTISSLANSKKSGEDDDSNHEKEYDSEGNELYEAEKIMNKRKEWDPKKKTSIWIYQIKWKDYGYEETTWEDEDCLHCPELLAEFEQKWAEKHGRD